MSKMFKSKEICSAKVDETLAAYITDLFRNGKNEDQYSEMIKDENNSRPENCEDLQVPREGPGCLSRQCVLRIPSVIVKGD